MNALVVLAAGLSAAGILPALAAARCGPVVIFLAPLTGAGLVAVAAVIEFGVGGTLPADYLAVAIAVNLAVVAWWLTAGCQVRASAGPWGWWAVAAVAVILGCLAIPLNDLRVPAIGADPNNIWLTHAFLAYGGHHAYFTGLRNPDYRFSHPDYPPLVPAAEALAFKFYGTANLHLGVAMTVLLTACALGVAGTGIAAAGIAAADNSGRQAARIAGIVGAGAICLAGFAVSGIDAADGYTDLLWAAAAVSAVIWGLVLPRSPKALGVAWICALVASLTKNEGFATALVMLALIALRYRPLSLRGPQLRGWVERAVFVVVPALPGLAWVGLMHLLGIRDDFFRSSSGQPPLTRAGDTVTGLAPHFAAVGPVALAVLLAGCWFLRADRERARFGNPAWLWLAGLGYITILTATYVIGGYPIEGWLATSANRTTTFPQVLLYADLAIWLVLAADGVTAPRKYPSETRGETGRSAAPEPTPVPPVTLRGRERFADA
jgi:hypothetical protein